MPYIFTDFDSLCSPVHILPFIVDNKIYNCPQQYYDYQKYEVYKVPTKDDSAWDNAVATMYAAYRHKFSQYPKLTELLVRMACSEICEVFYVSSDHPVPQVDEQLPRPVSTHNGDFWGVILPKASWLTYINQEYWKGSNKGFLLALPTRYKEHAFYTR